jgi:hypothetical protein
VPPLIIAVTSRTFFPQRTFSRTRYGTPSSTGRISVLSTPLVPPSLGTILSRGEVETFVMTGGLADAIEVPPRRQAAAATTATATCFRVFAKVLMSQSSAATTRRLIPQMRGVKLCALACVSSRRRGSTPQRSVPVAWATGRATTSLTPAAATGPERVRKRVTRRDQQQGTSVRMPGGPKVPGSNPGAPIRKDPASRVFRVFGQDTEAKCGRGPGCPRPQRAPQAGGGE